MKIDHQQRTTEEGNQNTRTAKTHAPSTDCARCLESERSIRTKHKIDWIRASEAMATEFFAMVCRLFLLLLW